MTKLDKKWLKKATSSENKYAKELIQASRYFHNIISEMDQYNHLMAQLVTSNKEEETSDIRFEDRDLQYLVTQHSQEVVEASRPTEKSSSR